MADIQHALSVLKFNAYQTPDFREQRGKNWILFGEKNDYPDYLVRLYQQSSKHSAIINGKVDYIIGQGWEVQGNMDEKEKGKAQMFIDAPNEDEDLMELASKAALDLELFGGFAIEIIKTRGSGFQLRHVAFHHLRTNAENDTFFYTRNWNVIRPEKNEDYKEIPAYDGTPKQTKSIFCYRQYSPKTSEYPVYPLPEYIGCIPYIEIDYEIANFHLNNIKNSFWGSFLMNFYNGIPSEEEQIAIEKKIKKKFSGTDNAGRFILNFTDGKERGAEMQPLTPNQMDKLFNQLNETVQQEIFTGHKVTSPMLFGIKTEGQLGGRAEIREAYELFKNTYIANRQKQLEDAFNYLFNGERQSRSISIIEKPPIIVEMPISEATADIVLTPTELREVIKERFGLNITPAIPKGAIPPGQNAPSPVSHAPKGSFSSQEAEERVINRFAKAGKPASNYTILKVRRVWFGKEEAINEENKLIKQCFASVVDGKVDDLSLKVLDYIDKNPDADANDIADALKIDEKQVNDILKSLLEAEYLLKDGENWTLTDSGSAVIPPPDTTVSSISVKYRYAKDPSVPGPAVLPTTRPLCKKLMEMDKLYDRKEIQKISNEEGYSVFLYRGGWYHNPQTHENQPFCRHIWEQVVVTERRNGNE